MRGIFSFFLSPVQRDGLEVTKVKTLLLSVLGGVVVTLLTGLVSNTPEAWLGATFYGYPLRWLTRLVLAPEYFPWRIDPASLIVDIIVWTAAVMAVVFVVTKVKK